MSTKHKRPGKRELEEALAAYFIATSILDQATSEDPVTAQQITFAQNYFKTLLITVQAEHERKYAKEA